MRTGTVNNVRHCARPVLRRETKSNVENIERTAETKRANITRFGRPRSEPLRMMSTSDADNLLTQRNQRNKGEREFR